MTIDADTTQDLDEQLEEQNRYRLNGFAVLLQPPSDFGIPKVE
jgi:hypothetical protein